MSEYDDLYDNDTSTDQDSNLVKKLRSKIDELSSRAKELEEQNQSLIGAQRKQSIESVVAARGLPPKVAALIPSNLDPTEENIDGWLQEFGDVFSVQSKQDAGQVQAQPTVVGSAADAEALRRMNAAQEGAAPTSNVSGDVLSQIESAGSLDELMSVLRGA